MSMMEYLALSNTSRNSNDLVVLLQEINSKLDLNNELLRQILERFDVEGERSF